MQVLPGGKGKKRPLPLFFVDSPWTAVQSDTVRAFGYDSAYFLHRLEWRLGVMKEDAEGRRWVYRSWQRWLREDLPHLGKTRFFKIVRSLKEQGVLLKRPGTIETHGQSHYSIDYEALRKAALTVRPPARVTKCR